MAEGSSNGRSSGCGCGWLLVLFCWFIFFGGALRGIVIPAAVALARVAVISDCPMPAARAARSKLCQVLN